MYAVGNLGVLRWIAPSAAPLWHRWSIAVLFGMSLVFLAWARKKDMAAREVCSACGEEMTVLYTFPFRAETGKHRIGKSGHHYHLFRMPGSVAYRAEEHRLRWLVCEKCRRYANKPGVWIIDLGEGEEAIARQEITYARIGQAQDRLAHAMTRKRPRRTAMKQKR